MSANRSKEECIKGLKCCTSLDLDDDVDYCELCPYKEYSIGGKQYKNTNCDDELMKDAIEYLI